MSIFDSPSEAGNGAFVEAAMAASALVATARGEVGFDERHKVDEILENLTTLTTFDFPAALAAFESFAEEIHHRPDQGHARALQAIAAIADRAEESRVLIRIACAVARDQGRYPPPCVGRIVEIAHILGQTPPRLESGPTEETGDRDRRAFCIAVGSQKGGTGKSTTAVHLAIGLLTRGHKVGCIDLDGDQGTFSHYLRNRRSYAEKVGLDLEMPLCHRLEASQARDRDEAELEERSRLNEVFEKFNDLDYLIVDTPGNQGHLSRIGHINADVLITPLNDSFFDIDVLAEIDIDQRLVLRPSPYAEMVMQQNDQRKAHGWHPIDWVVIRNRLAQLDARNSRDMSGLLAQLSERMGFRLLPGLSERVVFRELFYKGLTLHDLPNAPDEAGMSSSHWNARKEINLLLDDIAHQRLARTTTEMALFSAYLDASNADSGDEPYEASALGSEDAFLMLQEEMKRSQEHR